MCKFYRATISINKKKKMNQFTDINFWASVVSILSIFLALYIYWNDKREKQKAEQQAYLNQLEFLLFELKKNNEVILGFFDKDRAAWLDGKKIGYFRFSIGVTNKLISEGAIQNDTLLRNLDAIADNQNQVNRILDLITLMGQTSQISSQEERELFTRRITDASQTAMGLNDQIRQYMPKVINDLELHITQVKDK